MNTLEMQKSFYAKLVTCKGGVNDERLRNAFHTVDRARYCGPGPWWVAVLTDYIQTPSDDPAYLYQDIVVGLMPDRRINNGEPSLHARCLNAVGVLPGDQINRTVNPGLVPTSQTFGTAGGPLQPSPIFQRTDFWAQGVNFGLEYRY